MFVRGLQACWFFLTDLLGQLLVSQRIHEGVARDRLHDVACWARVGQSHKTPYLLYHIAQTRPLSLPVSTKLCPIKARLIFRSIPGSQPPDEFLPGYVPLGSHVP